MRESRSGFPEAVLESIDRAGACYEPKSILACRWTDFSPSRSRASRAACPEMERDFQRMGRSDVDKLDRARRRRILGLRGTPTPRIDDFQSA